MRITKCDICKKTINSGDESIRVERRGDIMKFANFEICINCSKPIMKILKNKKLLKDDKEDGKK